MIPAKKKAAAKSKGKLKDLNTKRNPKGGVTVGGGTTGGGGGKGSIMTDSASPNLRWIEV
jgi:hypothetical protein